MGREFLELKDIQIGEPDANAEYFSALRGHREPLFLNAFLMTPHLPLNQLLSGEKFLLHGQKGTGKTATLRYIERRVRETGPVEFLIFKKAFIEEIDLQAFAKIPLMVDEDEIKRFKHYHHALKRVFIYILISLSLQNDKESEIDGLDNDIMEGYFANIDPEIFLSRTWNKPRDFIRFFKCAKELFPE